MRTDIAGRGDGPTAFAAQHPGKWRQTSWWIPVAAGCLAILIRLPFLFRGETFFNSDEAVEGLMARHLGELPVFLWGQDYKGVPEVYLTAPVFAIVGVGVLQLKAVTLMLWSVAVLMLTRVAQRWWGAGTAVLAAVFLATGPPALVYWSLSGNAEIVVLGIVTGALLLDYQSAVDVPGQGVPNSRVWFWCGLAIWIHPAAVTIVAAFAAVVCVRSGWWHASGLSGLRDRLMAKGVKPYARAALLTLHAIILVLVVMFVLMFLGVTVHTGPISATHPQRSLRAIAGLCGLALVAHVLTSSGEARRRSMVAIGWFAAGLMPIFFQVARGGSVGTSVITRRITDLPFLLSGIAHEVASVLAGLRDPFGAPLAIPLWLAAGFMLSLAVHASGAVRACISALSRRWPPPHPADLFPALGVVAIAAFLVIGGGYQGVASYRYAMPFFGMVVLASADGVRRVAGRSRGAAALLAVWTLALFGVGEYRWCQGLIPDSSAGAMIDCLQRNNVRAGTADYWIAYRLTFIAGESVTVIPDAGPNRYLPYDRIVRAAPVTAHIARPASLPGAGPVPAGSLGRVICRTPSLEATIAKR